MKPKGHKRGCGCVVCSPRSNPKRKRTKRRNHGYENQAATLHERAAAMQGRTARRNSTVPLRASVRTRSMGLRRTQNPTDYEAARELRLYIENEGALYPQVQSIRKNLVTKMARGTYDPMLAVKAFKNLANVGAQRYVREFGAHGPHGSYGMFGPREREAAAAVMADDFFSEASAGEYDEMLPKKYQRKSNPAHYPRTSRGPKGSPKWFILDLYDGRGRLISTRIRKGARAKFATEAAGLVDRKAGTKMVRKVELSGPYSRKPTSKTARK